MSYDLQIWSVRRPDVETSLSPSAAWKRNGDGWSLEKSKWQIHVGLSDVVVPEDVPKEVSAILPGIGFLTEIALQPIGAIASGRMALFKAANALAKSSHGIVFDRQTDVLTTAKGVKRFVPQARDERFAVLELSWWFVTDDIFSTKSLEALLDVFEALLPEALPRRYGLYEPPQHFFAVEGRDHLLDFLHKNLDESPVLYPTRPVVGVEISFTKEHHHPRLGFRANRLSVECEASVLDQPGWQDGLRRFWLAVCAHLNPFFSDVRTLNGFLRMGPTYGSDSKTHVHPIRSWFWRGVPRELGHAAAIGNPYVDLWPQAIAGGQPYGELVVMDTGNWNEAENLQIEVPEGIRQSRTPKYETDGFGSRINWVDEYPEIWPFDAPKGE